MAALSPENITIRQIFAQSFKSFQNFYNDSWLSRLYTVRLELANNKIVGQLIGDTTKFTIDISEITSADQTVPVHDVPITVGKVDTTVLTTDKYRIPELIAQTADGEIVIVAENSMIRDIGYSLYSRLSAEIMKDLILTTDTKSSLLFIPRLTSGSTDENLTYKFILRMSRYLKEKNENPQDWSLVLHAKQYSQLLDDLGSNPYQLPGIDFGQGIIRSAVCGIEILDARNPYLPNVGVTQVSEATQDIDTITYPTIGNNSTEPGMLLIKRQSTNIIIGLTNGLLKQSQPDETNVDPTTDYMSMQLAFAVLVRDKVNSLGLATTYPSI